MRINFLLPSVIVTLSTSLIAGAIHPEARNTRTLKERPPEHGIRAINGRQEVATVSTATTLVSASTSTPASSSTASIPLPPSNIPTSPPQPVPTPLDLTLSYSLSHSCLTFFTSILPSPLFQSCLPLSLLLTTSTTYSDLLSDAVDSDSNSTSASASATNALATLNALLAYTSRPQPSPEQCDTYFESILKSMADRSNCAADLANKTPIAMTTKAGIGNYEVIRRASALTDPMTGKYCYLQAVMDDRPDDLYLWSIPAGIPLPKTSKPTCSPCSAALLASYSTADSSTLNATVVQQAVSTVNAACGGGFIVYQASAVQSAASIQSRIGGFSMWLSIGLAFGLAMLGRL